ncbi:MAG: hypothetical protein GY884_03260 [Proteobacteria bacterium]|nr:hypothetical protein [Pseudomonadota bacterium]
MTLLLALSGCVLIDDELEDIQEQFEGLTNPLVVQSAFLGVVPPDSDEIDLTGTDFDKGAGITVFLADAARVDEMEEAPISDADVQIRIGDTPVVYLTEEDDGAYKATADDGLTYTGNDQAVLTAVTGDSTSSVEVRLPPAPPYTVPELGVTGEPLPIDLAGTNYQQVSAVVIDSSGTVTWSNQPEGIQEWYEFANAEDAGGSFEIPGSAFPKDDVYAIGVAGLTRAEDADIDNANTALSSMLAGKLKFQPYLTQP